jgi:hypothetical protein
LGGDASTKVIASETCTMAKPRRRTFNTKEYREDVLVLAKENPELLANSATKMARREHNQAQDLERADDTTKELAAFLGSLVVMGLMGEWAGRINARRDELITQWENEGAGMVGTTLDTHAQPWEHAQGAKDPGKIWIFPKLAIIPLGSALAAGISSAFRRQDESPSVFERFATLSAMTSTTYLLASWVASSATKRTEKKFADGTLAVQSVRPVTA